MNWVVSLGQSHSHLTETLAINSLHVGGEGGNNCCIAERVLLIRGKSESCLSLGTPVIL